MYVCVATYSASMSLFITDSLVMVCFANSQKVYYQEAHASLGTKTHSN